ncbi:MAG: D-alanyl-D-alanine carboxypeptidase [Hyphomicrobiales bacterium]|nr:MAG: D-alanyl-D-alanine carboxypeptidase [Hyphomicrobiales bacterium]
MKRVLSIVCIACFCLAGGGGVKAAPFETPAEYVYMIDAETGTVLYEKNPDSLMAPASMSKLMTVEMVFDALKSGVLTMQDKFHISDNAWRKGGVKSGSSTMFAKLDSDIELKDLLLGVIVQSANDGCIAIAEGMSGTEAAFAKAMTRRAREIGLKKSTFANSTGWPDPGQKMTARELVMLADHIIRNYPDLYTAFGHKNFTWNGIKQNNRNPLLGRMEGADGLKTGHTQESGYGLVASVRRNGQRLILAMNGLKTSRQRAQEARKMIDWGFRAFRSFKLFDAGVEIARAKVWGGDAGSVGLVAAKPVRGLMPITAQKDLKAEIIYQGPLMAPVKRGHVVAELQISAPGGVRFSTPLQAMEDVSKAGLVGRGLGVLTHMVPGL